MDSDSFTIVADRLSEFTDLDRLAARGTVRLVFKKAGLDVKCFGLDDLEAVFTKVMPGELTARGCADALAACDTILESLRHDIPKTAVRSRDEIMRRLGSA